MQMTLKEYLQQSDPTAPIPSYLFTCGQLIALLDERDELREQLEIVANAEPCELENALTIEWLEENDSWDVVTYISGGEVCERKV